MNIIEASELAKYNDQILEYLKNGYELSFYPARQNSCIIIKVAKDGLCLSKLVNPTASWMACFDQLTIYGCILEALTELEKTIDPESSKNHKNVEFKVCYLSNSRDRIEKAKTIMESLTRGAKTIRFSNGFTTDKAEYVFTLYREPFCSLNHFDQIIIDWQYPMISIAEQMTMHSKLPKNQRVIDDRGLFNGRVDGIII